MRGNATKPGILHQISVLNSKRILVLISGFGSCLAYETELWDGGGSAFKKWVAEPSRLQESLEILGKWYILQDMAEVAVLDSARLEAAKSFWYSLCDYSFCRSSPYIHVSLYRRVEIFRSIAHSLVPSLIVTELNHQEKGMVSFQLDSFCSTYRLWRHFWPIRN